MLSYDNTAYGIWVPQSPQELLNDSATIFVGNITSVDVLQFDKKFTYNTEENGIVKNIIKNYTLSLDEYKVDVEEFLKNPQNTNKMTVRQPAINYAPGMIGGFGGFHVGDRVLFYVKNLDGNNTYSPESFIIPKYCVAKDVLVQKKLEARGESFTIQNGIKVDNNFTANKPIQFVDNEDAQTLSGKSFDILVHMTKITGSSPEIVLSKEIHSEAKPCEWIAPAEWEFTPQEGEYRMDVTITEDNKTYAQYNDNFFVKSDVIVPNMSPLKQMDSGISTENITCSNDLELVYKTSNKYPACVKHATAEKLVQRGWAIRGQPIYYFVKMEGFLVPYDLVGGNMLEAKFDVQTNSIIFSVDHTTSSGVLYVAIPRALLDSKSAYGNQDTKFIILVDKQEIKYTETTSITNRTLSIPFDIGAKEIEITAPVGI